MHAQAHAAFDANTLENMHRTHVPARAVIPAGNETAPVRFLAPGSNSPLAYRPYRLHIGPRLVLGRTDENGFTAPLSGVERATLTDWQVQ
jgi:hypothetical protein